LAEKRYVIPYGLDAQEHHLHETQRGKVVRFMVQLKAMLLDADSQKNQLRLSFYQKPPLPIEKIVDSKKKIRYSLGP
jgi:hypothetical protein